MWSTYLFWFFCLLLLCFLVAFVVCHFEQWIRQRPETATEKHYRRGQSYDTCTHCGTEYEADALHYDYSGAFPRFPSCSDCVLNEATTLYGLGDEHIN